jgi:hypothetical protein
MMMMIMMMTMMIIIIMMMTMTTTMMIIMIMMITMIMTMMTTTAMMIVMMVMMMFKKLRQHWFSERSQSSSTGTYDQSNFIMKISMKHWWNGSGTKKLMYNIQQEIPLQQEGLQRKEE